MTRVHNEPDSAANCLIWDFGKLVVETLRIFATSSNRFIPALLYKYDVFNVYSQPFDVT